MIAEEDLQKAVAEVLKERAVHHKLDMTSRDVRNYRVWLKQGKLSTKLMLEVLNRAGQLTIKKVPDNINNKADAGSDKGED